jgi:hypothetical protein
MVYVMILASQDKNDVDGLAKIHPFGGIFFSYVMGNRPRSGISLRASNTERK